MLEALNACPRKHLHTRCPEGYCEWHEWAEKKGRRHYVIRCPGCELWAIWKRKPADMRDDEHEVTERGGE